MSAQRVTLHEGLRVRSREYGAEGVVTLVRDEVCMVRLQGDGLSAAISSLMGKISRRRRDGIKVDSGWALLASMGEAEADGAAIEMIWLCGDLECAEEVH